MYRRWVVGLFLISSVAAAGSGQNLNVSKMEVAFINKLGEFTPSLNTEAYNRELRYEERGLTLEEKAENEARLLAEKVRYQVVMAYEAAFDETYTEEEAARQVEVAIRKDLELAQAELRPELLRISLEALQDAKRGKLVSQSVSSEFLTIAQTKNVKERMDYLATVSAQDAKPSEHFEVSNFGGSSKTGKLVYSSKEELLSDLVSDAESVRWVSTSNTAHKSETVLEAAGKVTLQVKIDFLGVELEAGPKIFFKKQYKTLASMFAEGLHPVLFSDGNFDFSKRDKFGNIMYDAEGKPRRRFASFYCEVALQFESEYGGQGGFRILGAGAETALVKNYTNIASLTSRRVTIPDNVAGKSVTVKFLSDLCAKDFIHTQVNAKMKVSDSLDYTMKNMVAGLKFSHPLTNCATDDHCVDWYNNEVLALLKVKSVPRCVEDHREKSRSCALRGTRGQNCALYAEGKRISSGFAEYVCDEALKCVQTKKGGWFEGGQVYQAPKGTCLPR